MTRSEKREYWRGLVTEQAGGEESVTAFCARKKISSGGFHYWRRRLREGERSEARAGEFVELVAIGRDGPGSGVTIQVGSEVRIELAKGFDGATLRAALGVVVDSGRCFR